MNVVVLSPGYPAEMAYFTRALAEVGDRVIGVGDQPPDALPEAARSSMAHYEHVDLADAAARARGQRRGVRRRRGVHLRHDLRRRPDPVRARPLVPAAAAADAHARVGQPGVDLAARPVRAAAGRRTADGPGGA